MQSMASLMTLMGTRGSFSSSNSSCINGTYADESESMNMADMKFICEYEKNELINVKSRTISKKTAWTAVTRWWTGEDRRMTYDFLQSTINRGLDMVEKKLMTEFAYENQGLPGRIFDFIQSLTALENLIFTYSRDDDRSFRCQVRTLKHQVQTRLLSLYQRYPSVFPSHDQCAPIFHNAPFKSPEQLQTQTQPNTHQEKKIPYPKPLINSTILSSSPSSPLTQSMQHTPNMNLSTSPLSPSSSSSSSESSPLPTSTPMHISSPVLNSAATISLSPVPVMSQEDSRSYFSSILTALSSISAGKIVTPIVPQTPLPQTESVDSKTTFERLVIGSTGARDIVQTQKNDEPSISINNTKTVPIDIPIQTKSRRVGRKRH